MNIVSFPRQTYSELPVVVCRLQFQTPSPTSSRTGNYGQSAGMFFVRRSGRFLRQGTRRILNLFRALLKPLQKSASRAADRFKAFLPHGVNHDGRRFGNVRKSVGEIRNV